LIPSIRWRLFAHGIRYYGAVGALLCSPDSAGHSEKPRFNLSEGCIYLARVDRGKAPSYFPSNFIIRFTAVNSQKASHVAASFGIGDETRACPFVTTVFTGGGASISSISSISSVYSKKPNQLSQRLSSEEPN